MRKLIRPFIFIILVALYQPAGAQGVGLLSGEAANYYNKAVKAQNKGDFNTAYTLYQKTMFLNPAFQVPVINNMGVMFVYRNEWDKAKLNFSKALSIAPDYKPALFNLGLLHYMRGDEKEALRYWIKFFEVGELGFRSFIIEQEIGGEESDKAPKK